ncbi:MAG: hypothetical protein P8P74_08480 [Crocinitomicaceae bacterium]|nr:hypothetical protein [Crocinitomicaceae bacterium]
MKKTSLNFINRSKESKPQNIVIYQSNEASMSHNEIPIAWKVIKKCGVDQSHSFEFNMAIQVAMGDSFGNYRQPIDVEIGRIIAAVPGDFSGDLELTDRFTHNPNEFDVINKMGDGSISANCFRNEMLLATRDYIYPGDSVSFRFSEIIRIAVAPGVEQGDELDPFRFEGINVELNLAGIESADIIMTGGGKDLFQFSMENVERKMFSPNHNLPDWFNPN